MPFTLVAYSEAQDASTAANIAAVADPHVTVSGDDITVPALTFLAGAYFLGSDLSRGIILSPSLSINGTSLDISSVDTTTANEPATNPQFTDLFESPIPLARSEALNTQAVNAAANSVRANALIWLSDGKITALPAGKIFSVRTTNATTLTTNTWTNGALTFTRTLPAGRYAVVGMRAESAGLKAARLVFVGYQWRPGVIGFDAVGDFDNSRFRYGNAGVFGEFEHNEPPTVDFFSLSADTSQVVYLDLIKIK